jgi:hypothetical protein
MQPRPVLPVPTNLLIADQPILTPVLESIEDLGDGHQRGRLVGAGETVHFHLQRVRDDRKPRPFVLLVPILAGGNLLLEIVGGLLVDRGFDVAWCERVDGAMVKGQRSEELDRLLQRTVLQQRLLLAWVHGPENPPPTATFVLGISVGGIIATTLAALEPGLDGVAICLAGGDLKTLLPRSGEWRVRRWVEWRKTEDGVGRDHLEWELEHWLVAEPLVTAASIPPGKVLFVSAAFDDVVPRRNQDLLWEALGRPARMTVPLGHYWSALALHAILSAAADHFTARIGAQAGSRAH